MGVNWGSPAVGRASRSRKDDGVASRRERSPRWLDPPQGDAAGPDSRLVRLAVSAGKEGDREAMHFLYVRFAPDLLRYVNSLVKDAHDAEDIVQNVFAK